MSQTIKGVLISITTVGVIVTLIWYYQTKTLESLSPLIFSFASLVALIFGKEITKKRNPSQNFKQSSGKNSTQYQAGRDIEINK